MAYLSVVLALVAAFTGIYYFYTKKQNLFKKHGILHVPPAPFLGNMGRLITKQETMIGLMQETYDLHADAKYVGFYDFFRPIIILRDPELIKSVAVKNFDNFRDHRGFISPATDPLLGGILFNLTGDRWKEERNLLSPSFTSSKMKSMFKLMTECAVRFTDAVAKLPEKERDMETKTLFTKYTNDVIASCVYGVSVNSMEDPKNAFYVYGRKAIVFTGFVNSLKMLLHRNLPTLATALRVRILPEHVSKFFEDQLSNTIKTREESGIYRADMIQLLMDSRNKKVGGQALSMDQIAAHAFGFYFGGLDTVASQTCLTVQMLTENPDVQTTLQNEIDEALENGNGELTYEALNEMKYLDAVVNETLRLYPIAIFLDRMCTKSFELPPALPGQKPFVVQEGMNIWIPVKSIQTDPKYYDDPEKFDPDRFMDTGKKILNSGTYMPFGLGPRICIGNRFALTKMKVLLAYLLARFDIKPGKKTVIPMKLEKGVLNVAPKNGFWLKLEPRKNAHPFIRGGGSVNDTANGVCKNGINNESAKCV